MSWIDAALWISGFLMGGVVGHLVTVCLTISGAMDFLLDVPQRRSNWRRRPAIGHRPLTDGEPKRKMQKPRP